MPNVKSGDTPASSTAGRQLDCERFLGAAHYERTSERRGYANGYNAKRLDTRAGTVPLDVPKTAGTDEPFHANQLASTNKDCARIGRSHKHRRSERCAQSGF